MLTRLMRILTLTFVAGMGPAAWGQGVGGNSPTETTHMVQTIPQAPEAPTMWETLIGSADARIGVELDPLGPTWLKHLQRSGPAGSFEPQHFINIYEHLAVSGQRSWTGWTQQIDVPGFEWRRSGPYVQPTTILANGAVPSGLNIETDGSMLRFTFDPLPPGTHIDITSGLRYGSTVLPGSFDIQQFPIPEPATLLGFLALVSLIRRR